jgi:hypothetical protein
MTGIENPYPVTSYGYIYYIPLWAHDFGARFLPLRTSSGASGFLLQILILLQKTQLAAFQ